MAGWMIRLGATHVVPIINLLTDLLLEASLIHCDETRLQVLNSDKSPAADHWMWVRAAGPPGRRIILFDYDPSRGGAVPRRLKCDGAGGAQEVAVKESRGETAKTWVIPCAKLEPPWPCIRPAGRTVERPAIPVEARLWRMGVAGCTADEAGDRQRMDVTPRLRYRSVATLAP